MSTVARRCYQMITLATDEDVMSPESSDKQFGDITEELL
jgi:hypothetical protein